MSQLRFIDERTLRVTHQPMPDGGFVATHEDITDQQRAERELRSTKHFLDTVLANVPMPLLVKDPRTQVFTFVNQAYVDFVGRPREELIGRTVYDLYPHATAQVIVDHDLEAAQTWRSGAPAVKAEFPVETSRGVRILNTVRLVVAAGDDDGPGLLITVFEDVTDRRFAEAQVVHMAMHDALTD
ncbi:MAG TPA: PAS-domain containing protein, partial [Caldimonas sp.]|nr:PAS-domain containing protein [Caldimonas sp.]